MNESVTAHTESRATVSDEFIAVLLMFTQYSVRGTVLHVTLMMFAAFMIAVMTVSVSIYGTADKFHGFIFVILCAMASPYIL